LVLEQNPSKQGLKHQQPQSCLCEQRRFRAKSIKTRIETETYTKYTPAITKVLEQNPSKQGLKPSIFEEGQIIEHQVLEQNPSKQGLKPRKPSGRIRFRLRFRAKSIKTRIETFFI